MQGKLDEDDLDTTVDVLADLISALDSFPEPKERTLEETNSLLLAHETIVNKKLRVEEELSSLRLKLNALFKRRLMNELVSFRWDLDEFFRIKAQYDVTCSYYTGEFSPCSTMNTDFNMLDYITTLEYRLQYVMKFPSSLN